MNISFSHHTIAFAPADPLGDGLGDEISIEQQEAERIDLREQFDPELATKWQEIVDDVEKDPSWFDFAKDE